MHAFIMETSRPEFPRSHHFRDVCARVCPLKHAMDETRRRKDRPRGGVLYHHTGDKGTTLAGNIRAIQTLI